MNEVNNDRFVRGGKKQIAFAKMKLSQVVSPCFYPSYHSKGKTTMNVCNIGIPPTQLPCLVKSLGILVAVI